MDLCIEIIEEILRECRTKGGKSLIELQIFNGASPIKLIQDTNVCLTKESGNAVTLHYFVWRQV